MEQIPLPLPPLAEQRRIVERIEELFTRLEASVEALKKVRTQIRRYRQAVLKYAFEGKLTEEWRRNNPSSVQSGENDGKLEKDESLRSAQNDKGEACGENLSELPDFDGVCSTDILVFSKKQICLKVCSLSSLVRRFCEVCKSKSKRRSASTCGFRKNISLLSPPSPSP